MVIIPVDTTDSTKGIISLSLAHQEKLTGSPGNKKMELSRLIAAPFGFLNLGASLVGQTHPCR